MGIYVKIKSVKGECGAGQVIKGSKRAALKIR